jgi:hypothetical protein
MRREDWGVGERIGGLKDWRIEGLGGLRGRTIPSLILNPPILNPVGLPKHSGRCFLQNWRGCLWEGLLWDDGRRRGIKEHLYVVHFF